VTGCRFEGLGYPNVELVIEYEVIGASVQPNKTLEPFPYILTISMRRVAGGGRVYKYYSEKEYTKKVLVDTLVMVNGEPPNGVDRDMEGYLSSAMFSVYLDYLPKEGDLAEFNQNLFFAISNEYPRIWEEVEIITESIQITIQ
jgi:hypothetical protein